VTPRRLALALAIYVALLVLACAAVAIAFRLSPSPRADDVRVVSLWRAGQRVARSVRRGDARQVLAKECAADAACTRIIERIVDSTPLPYVNALLFSVSVAAGRDGIAAQLGGRTAYLTPSDLLSRQASGENGADLGPIKIRIGVHGVNALLDALASELGSDRATLLARGKLRRFIIAREDAAAAQWPRKITPAQLNVARLRRAILLAGRFLARNQQASGRFTYEIDSTQDRDLPGYSWPRHGGATLFLAQAASYTGDDALRVAAMRAARFMQRSVTLRCGKHRCVGEGTRVDVGSSALAILAYHALLEVAPLRAMRDDIRDLAGFLRGQLRPDGESMHEFDRNTGKPIDVQYPYYSGELAFALARAARVTQDPEDLRAASAALASIVRRTWSIAENRYFFGTEHWTCQALEELWDRAPDRDALAFCLDYQGYNRLLQAGPGSMLGDYDGGFGQSPFFPPRLTPAGSRAEGAVATLATAIAAQASASQIAALEQQVRRALAFIMRFQFDPGPLHLLRNPARAFGGLPGGPTDMHLRVDFPQHCGGAMLRYARMLDARTPPAKR
jgi:hypothetical protein